ncbi:uncharacterized protein LOC122244928, partial [Penaeus japonicus]|uniref:uncharacterized protein LOC122244928 n=1 Tax=Penaeus japonicus TaxID=27405 RepID=UPI001C7149B7
NFSPSSCSPPPRQLMGVPMAVTEGITEVLALMGASGEVMGASGEVSEDTGALEEVTEVSDEVSEVTEATEEVTEVSEEVTGASGPAHYSYEYAVNDNHLGTNFGHKEVREGYTTKGSYFVHLPDGRLQTVNYVADEHGYHPEVSFEGVAHHAVPVHHHAKGHHGKGYH